MAVGCASRPVGPVDVLAAYTEALRDGRLVDAWRMLSAEARQSLSYADFERAAREHPDEVREVVSANLCRCTGYQGIVDAIVEVAELRRTNGV